MVLLNNPTTADLQSRIQNSDFGSPNYLGGFTGTMPLWQQNQLMQNYTPSASGILNTGAENNGLPNYLGYTPGAYTPPSVPQPLPFYDQAANAYNSLEGSEAQNTNQNNRLTEMQDQYGSIDGKFYDLKTGELIDNGFANFFGKMFGGISDESSIQKMLENKVDPNKLPSIVSDPKYQKLMIDNGMFRKEVGGDYNYGGATSSYGGSLPNTIQRMLGGGGGVAGTGLKSNDLGYNAGQVDPGFVTKQVNPQDTGPAKGSNASDKRQKDRDVGNSGTSASSKNTGSGSQATKAGATTGRKDGGFGW